MKFIRLYIIIAAFTGMLMSPAGAQPEGELTLEPVRNPFIPQLPEKPKIDETAAAQTQTQTQNQNQQNQGSVRTPNAEKGRPTVKKPSGVDTTPAPPPIPKPNFRITGLIWNSPRPQVIINGQVLDIGDEVQGFRIEAINQTGVDVSIRGVTQTVEP